MVLGHPSGPAYAPFSQFPFAHNLAPLAFPHAGQRTTYERIVPTWAQCPPQASVCSSSFEFPVFTAEIQADGLA